MVVWAEGPEGAKTGGLTRTGQRMLGRACAFKEPRRWAEAGGCPASEGSGPLAVGRGWAPDLCGFWGILSS